MFSMLRQMLEDDRNEHVREAAVKSLSLILAFVDDNGKYTQVGRRSCYHVNIRM